MANILMLAHGTEGDVRPLAWIGRALKSVGHTVTVITHCAYEQLLQNLGLNFAFIDTPAEYEQLLKDESHPLSLSEQAAYFQRRVLPKMAVEYRLLQERHAAGETVLLTHSNTYGVARILAEKLSLPIATIYLAPFFLATAPMVQSALVKVLGPEVNQIRADFGLPAVDNWSKWWWQDSHPIALWPDWYAAREPVWPTDLVQAGFLTTPSFFSEALPAEVEAFLTEGEPPVLVTGGTGIFVEMNYYEACLEACQRLGRRVVLVARHQTFAPRCLPESVVFFPALPFSSLIPRVAMVIHHGGIGTTSQALAAGVPQVILARGLDRPDNAQRVERLGIGRYLPSIRWQADAVTEALDWVMKDEHIGRRCQELAQRIDQHDTLTPIVNLIEAIARKEQNSMSMNMKSPSSVPLSQQRFERMAQLREKRKSSKSSSSDQV